MTSFEAAGEDFIINVRRDGPKKVLITLKSADGVTIMPGVAINPHNLRSRRDVIHEIINLIEIEYGKLSKDEKEGVTAALLTELEKITEQCENSNQDGERAPLAKRLIELGLERFILFRDEHNKAFAAVKLNGKSIAVMPVRSRDFRNLLHRLLWEREGRAANPEAISSAIATLEAIACFEGEQHRLSLRVAWKDGKMLYDMGRPDWKLIEIDAQGWRYVGHQEPIFRRYQHMQAQVEPDPEAKPEDFKRLLRHIRIANGDGLLYLCNVASFLIPDIPHPIPVAYGAQGSGKTTAYEMTRRVVDPSSLEVLSFPHDNKELIQKLAHNYVALFDNVSKLSKEQSDILCRAVTGTAQSKRELYTDDEDFYYRFIRCVGTNGINISGLEPDFQDRAIIYELERIPVTERKPIREVKEAFERDLPKIVGGLFSAISKAMAIVGEVRRELTTLPRMADFTVWGEAIARALGYEPLEFFNAYMKKLRRQNREVLEADAIGDLLIKFMENRDSWEGTPTKLLRELTQLAGEYGVDKIKGFPRAPHTLTRRLNKLTPNLAEEGITIERYETGGGKNNKRQIRITRRDPGKGEGEDIDRNKAPEKCGAKALQALQRYPPGPEESNAMVTLSAEDGESVTKALPDSPGPSNGSNTSNAFAHTFSADLRARLIEVLRCIPPGKRWRLGHRGVLRVRLEDWQAAVTTLRLGRDWRPEGVRIVGSFLEIPLSLIGGEEL
ncbi:MAG: hypothetical protein GXN98_01940 [Euryarchaeota archaeon]|nr:hypothetical protein [Euryarchaeota archaeon]